MPCGGEEVTLRWDGSFALLEPFVGFEYGTITENNKPWLGGEFCFTSLLGDTAYFASKFAVCTVEDGASHPCEIVGEIVSAFAVNDDPESGCSDFTLVSPPDGDPRDAYVSPCGYDDVVGAEALGCTAWPDFLTELSGHGEGPITTVTYNAYLGTWSKETTTYHARPYVRWDCRGVNRVVWEVGWYVISESYLAGPFETEPDDSPVEPEIVECPAEFIVNSQWRFCGGYPISTGETDTSWHLGGPFELQNSVGTGGDTFNSTITPVICAYEPCGDPLDCFAACISGSKDCDGVTPAHVPVVYLTLTHLVSESLGCCFVGTYPLEFGAGSGAGTGYYLDPDATCTTPINGFTYTMKASLTCATYADPDSPNGAGSNTAYLIVQFFGPGGAYALYSATVSLSCTDGVLDDASGVWTGTGCGLFGVIGWSISV